MKENNDMFQYANFISALLLSLVLAILYYLNNINGIDTYNQFIYGDTINLSYSKITDYRFLLLFSVFFIFLFVMFDKVKFIKQSIIRCVVVIKSLQIIEENNPKILKVFNLICSTLQEIKANKLTLIVFNMILVLFFSYLSSKILFSLIGSEYYSIFNRNVFIILMTAISLSLKKRSCLASQLFLSASPLVYLNERYIYDGGVVHFQASEQLNYLLCSIALVSLVISINDVRRNNSKISFSLLVFICITLIGESSRVYSLDEYHFGEIFTNFHQGVSLSQSYYSSYIPTKGFMHTFIGFVNSIFYDGGYTTIGLSIKLSSLITSILILGILSLFYRKTIILALLIIGLPLNGHYAPILVGLCLLSSKRVVNNSYNFVLASLLFSFIYFVYYNAFSIAFGLVIFPVLVFHLKEIITHKYYPNKWHSFLFVSSVLLFVCFFDYISSSIGYALSNSSSNLLYWGNPGNLKSLLKGNLWILIPMMFFPLFYTKKIALNKENALWISFLIIFPFTILSYLEGRADWKFTRAFAYTAFCLPILFAFINSKSIELNRDNKLIFSSLALILFLFNNNQVFNRVKDVGNFHNVFSDNIISKDYILINESEIPNLGNGFIDKSRYQDLKDEYSLISMLSSDETFLVIDEYVTQSARYSIFDKLVPTLSHSILNISSLKLQSEELIKVKKSNVKIIRVSNGVRRYHLFFNYLASLDFKFISFKGKDYLVAPEILESIKNKLEFNVNGSFVEKYSTKYFGLLPIKWGTALKSQMFALKRVNINYSISPINSSGNTINSRYPLAVYNVNNQLQSSSVDLINLNFSIEKGLICNAQLFWDDGYGFNEAKSLNFKIGNGNNVIPLHMNFNWRNSGKILKLRFDFEQCDNKDVTFKGIQGYKYKFPN